MRLELWERLLGALGAAPDCDAAQLSRAAAAALADTRGAPAAYPRLFYCVGEARPASTPGPAYPRARAEHTYKKLKKSVFRKIYNYFL